MGTLLLKKQLVYIWNISIDIKINLINKFYLLRDKFYWHILRHPIISPIDETLKEIIVNDSSVARYGDGEFKLINNRDITFQKADAALSLRLQEILVKNENNLLVCIPDIFRDLSQYGEETHSYWKLHISKYRLNWYKKLDSNKKYYNSFISRFYYPFKDKSKSKEWLELLKLIWNDKDVLLIEGKKSRLGVGNDLFDNVKRIERIIVPEENAFAYYDKILLEAKKSDKSNLVLIAAGPTATVLAYDLYKLGYQAIDIGHVDIEYEWFIRQSKTKIKIENKYVCEAGAGKGVGDIQDEKYLSEVKTVIF
ncbi:SP_1767 family glycosyltransferase [Bacillus sp. PAMC26568]|nr:SP_1767 family glycosyltransferase [Bacillus sp. PAMC26568]